MIFRFASNSKPLAHLTASSASARAATILSSYLTQITSATFDINPNSPSTAPIEFIETDAYGDSGFGYSVTNHILTIEAQNEQAFVYAVYDLLERIMGCHYYTSEVEYVPTNSNLTTAIEAYHYVPPIDYREIYYKDFENKSFAEKHKAATAKQHEGWGFWCHSFQELLPHATYFEAHPEYFALIEGERHPQGEPCLSNPEVKKIMLNNLKKFIDEKPECKYWSVSQNDDNLYCQCEHCAKVDAYDESPMGSVLNFVNEAASQFPDKVISTLSYWYTRKPPKHTRPEKNVHIMTCNIEANRGLPIATDPTSLESKQELEFWASISDNVSLWDYNIQFRNLVSPFPNLRTLGPNMQFFAENKVKLLFSQCNREIGGEFHELRGYILAKLAWDPYSNVYAHTESFCTGYYGEAAPYILDYIELLHDAQEAHNHRLDIFGSPKDAMETYLTKDLFKKYEELFDLAMNRVAQDDTLLPRVEKAYLPVCYAGIVLKYGSKKQRLERVTTFARIARVSGLHMVEEWKITMDQFVVDSLIEI